MYKYKSIKVLFRFLFYFFILVLGFHINAWNKPQITNHHILLSFYNDIENYLARFTRAFMFGFLFSFLRLFASSFENAIVTLELNLWLIHFWVRILHAFRYLLDDTILSRWWCRYSFAHHKKTTTHHIAHKNWIVKATTNHQMHLNAIFPVCICFEMVFFCQQLALLQRLLSRTFNF